MNDKGVFPVFDPYDPWSSSFGLNVKQKFYQGRLSGKIAAIGIGLMDWIFPRITRAVFDSQPRVYPIVVALEILCKSLKRYEDSEGAESMLTLLKSTSIDPSGANGWAWGLGFPWMSKNGLYGPDIPFVTHTPYAMEALLSLSRIKSVKNESYDKFICTWDFLQTLLVMHKEDDQIALSYAPVVEPRIVVNANSYAALAYALHAVYGRDDVKDEAIERVTKLVNWVVSQQQDDGSWHYYADKDQGNFIDCFHSCFIIKNLMKVKTLVPEVAESVNSAIQLGWSFINNNFYDKKSGLCRRFVRRDIKDPFRWDIYDQAEYLGLLVDFGRYDEATQFARRVEGVFKKSDNWYCRLDLFGRRWGKNFMRWGIAPFLYHKARLDRELNKTASSCAA